MPRKKLTEYKSKKILYPYLEKSFNGFNVVSDSEYELEKSQKYVVKVDQGIKKRFKLGLMAVNVDIEEIKQFVKEKAKLGYTSFFVDEMVPHESDEERYLSLERIREGIQVTYSEKGGIDIEENKDSLQQFIIKDIVEAPELEEKLKLPPKLLGQIVKCFEENFISFLEINPLVITSDNYYILDLAVEVDSTAEFFVKTWKSSDFVEDKQDEVFPEVKEVEELKEKSTASFRLNVLNKDGALFMLLSGGGASIVLADEAYNLGHSKLLANYGEYSGNPNTEETYIYTKSVLSLMLKSKAPKKALIIAGGVANFTDVYQTFQGVIQALGEYKDKMNDQGIKVFVRRGGPNQKLGLKVMEDFLKENNLFANVSGPDMPLSQIVHEAIDYVI